METQSSFGIIITCFKGDYFLTKGLLASLNKFLPQIPICIIQDGDFAVLSELSIYNIKFVIKKDNVKNDFLREKCFGSRCSNLIAFFESPFEHFLYLDSDIVLWGNILDGINIKEADFIYNEPHELYNSRIYKEQYFDYDNVFKYTEYFEWSNCHFFNSGVFISRKNIFEFEEFKELINLWYTKRDLLPTDPQSILNILVFRNYLKGKISISEKHLQTIVPVLNLQYLNDNFIIKNEQPVVHKNTVIHWAGQKPYLITKKTFLKPMIYFRKLNLYEKNSYWKKFPIFFLYVEEYNALLYIILKKLTFNKLLMKIKKLFSSV